MTNKRATRAILKEAGECIITVLAYICGVVLLLATTGFVLSLIYALTRNILTQW